MVAVAQVMYSDDTRPFPFPHRLIRKETVGYARLIETHVRTSATHTQLATSDFQTDLIRYIHIHNSILPFFAGLNGLQVDQVHRCRNRGRGDTGGMCPPLVSRSGGTGGGHQIIVALLYSKVTQNWM